MDRETFALLEDYMNRCMEDSAHDREHIRRVLHMAMVIARDEPETDYDVLIAACLLHDIGRKEQFADPTQDHALAGGKKAWDFLREQGFDEDFAWKVRRCIETHRFRRESPPQSLEAKILFDADKLDVAGAMGIARSLLYQGKLGLPLYRRDPAGAVLPGEADEEASFFREYHFKLEKLYDRFYTRKGRELAQSRRQAAADFYEALLGEARQADNQGAALLEDRLL